jgi:1-acyl-sn-glycerol-3-phosphate acyltransferase
MNKFYKWIYFRVIKWKLIGEFPKIDKMVLAVVSHTHWNDFLLGILIRNVINEQINFVGKKEIFGPFTGWFFKMMGGTSVDRGSNSNTVSAIANIFKQKKVFRLALAPEGTRKKVKDWKTGFYHIAKIAKVPICLVAFDYGKKQIVFHPEYHPSGNIEKDINFLKKQFKGVVGRIPDYSWVYED